ncbi:terminal uridylyltransferase 7 [Ornithorhynchus anatinus]|uniref:terminal uridylyltransferase 7 n=1 Tax=Ornithorhynchus anatinus TaxID=9258 RepID=UPI0010A86ABD|nr:terminal uridylyltransferase 7 [Ornithorhynchus anatinus]
MAKRKQPLSFQEYFFDPEVLTEGELAPNDRCCRICGKIGHFMRDCPLRRKLRRRRDFEDPKGQRCPDGKEKKIREDREAQSRSVEKESSATPEGRKKQKAKASSSPRSGSLPSRYPTQGKASPKKTQGEF